MSKDLAKEEAESRRERNRAMVAEGRFKEAIDEFGTAPLGSPHGAAELLGSINLDEAIAAVLGTHVQRLATIAHGDGVCTTCIPQNLKPEPKKEQA